MSRITSTNDAKVAIFDYGAGNIFSLKAALERNGANAVYIIHDLRPLGKFDGLILPGVGNFDPAIRSIEKDKDLLAKAIGNRLPILGICLGMEILFNRSEEGRLEGLKALDGEVIMLDKKNVKVPHIGWNNIRITKNRDRKNRKGRKNNDNSSINRSNNYSRLLENIKDNSWVYFVHSYRILPGIKNEDIVVASSKYGDNIPAVIEKGNIFGTQFHPEKSGNTGAEIMKNFLRICTESI
jgi:imidazole glycerol-phosphate synthase subunit HisH